jgi:hypothetical protein
MDTEIKEYENNPMNYDLKNPIYRAGYRYALLEVEKALDKQKNECFTISYNLEKGKHVS